MPDEIAHSVWNHNCGGNTSQPSREPRNAPQRWPVQMVKVRVSDKHVIDSRQVFDPHADAWSVVEGPGSPAAATNPAATAPDHPR